jgi:hypothetical protein
MTEFVISAISFRVKRIVVFENGNSVVPRRGFLSLFRGRQIVTNTGKCEDFNGKTAIQTPTRLGPIGYDGCALRYPSTRILFLGISFRTQLAFTADTRIPPARRVGSMLPTTAVVR